MLLVTCRRFLRTAAGLLVATSTTVLAATAAVRGDERVVLLDLEGRPVEALATAPGVRAVVALFVSVECPISNRYAPELRRIEEQYSSRGVEFLLIYPNPAESVEDIRAHVASFRHPGRVLRDPDHVLVRHAGVSITPEAAVYDASGRLAYRGRIDDRHVRLGLERPAPTRRDLAEALDAMLSGRPIDLSRTDAVGCFIADFVHVH